MPRHRIARRWFLTRLPRRHAEAGGLVAYGTDVACALGLTISPAILLRADHVID